VAELNQFYGPNPCYDIHITYRDKTFPTQFASDIGGAIGLWTALSILSIFELVQLLMELCVVFKRKLKM
jgi:hypothetical protein